MFILEVEPLDLGPNVRAINLELVESDEDRMPVVGKAAAETWSRVLLALAGTEPWGFDFFSQLDRVREFCQSHNLKFLQPAERFLVVPAPEPADLESLLSQFEIFGVRAGKRMADGDPGLEHSLSLHGMDAYHDNFGNYLFCAIADLENGSLVVLSNTLWANQIIRLVKAILDSANVEVRLPA